MFVTLLMVKKKLKLVQKKFDLSVFKEIAFLRKLLNLARLSFIATE